jgi:hypothetical protein
MATVTTSQIGNGTTAYASDIVVKDLDMTVSNYVKDRTPVTNMAFAKKTKINSVIHLWANDVYRLPAVNAAAEGAAVAAANAESNQRANLGNYSQIFVTVVGATGTARAVEQAGGDPQAYQEVKQLTEIMFDVEAQIVRNDQIGTKYGGQSGSATGLPANQVGRRFGSLSSFAGTQSFNTTSGTTTGISTNVNNESTDAVTTTANTFTINANGSTFYTGTFTNQTFSPVLYKQLVTAAEQRFNAKITDMVVPTSLRTTVSTNVPQSRGINRVMSEAGDSIMTYEGDFNYTYEISDNWIMDQVGMSNSIYFLNPDVIQWGSLRDLGPNNEVFSNADASLDQYILEGTLLVRNPAGVGLLNNITTGSLAIPDTTTARPSALVQRLSSWGGGSF